MFVYPDETLSLVFDILHLDHSLFNPRMYFTDMLFYFDLALAVAFILVVKVKTTV